MSWFYRNVLRPGLFTQDPEAIHNFTMRALGWISRSEMRCAGMAAFFGAPELPVEVFGLRFPNPVGLAAGMDKLAEAAPVWPALGFGFSELGAATWHPQPGNPLPRVFRAVADQAIINRMGFNNPGAEAIARTLAEWRVLGRWPSHPVGINLGKSRVTPLEKAAEDYANSFRALRPYADFFVVNVSSPNTPNLRQLQDKAALDEILAALQEVQNEAWPEPGPAQPRGDEAPESAPSATGPPPHSALRTPHSALRTPHLNRPVLVKVAPDLSFAALDEILELAGPRQVAGIVAVNTTITRPKTSDPKLQRIYAEAGGLSGRPLARRSTEIIRHLYQQTKGALPIIGVGGIFTAEDAWEKIQAGASLVQIYTGMIYEGPGAAKAIVTGLKERMREAGVKELGDVKRDP